MGITELRQLDQRALRRLGPLDSLSKALVRDRILSKSDAQRAQLVQRYCDTSLDRILRAETDVSDSEILSAKARNSGVHLLQPDEMQAALDPAEAESLDPRTLIKHKIAPVGAPGGKRYLATDDPMRRTAIAPGLAANFAGLPTGLATAREVETALAREFRAPLTELAQARVDPTESCRTWSASPYKRLALTLCLILGCLGLSLLAPQYVFLAFVCWASFTLIVVVSLKIAAFVARMLAGDPTTQIPPMSDQQKLPKVSVLVPLFRETEIAHALITRLSRLTYPKCLLDVVLVLEENDALTQQTLAQIDLPPWMRAIIVPDGQPRTKPRAMNYALDFCDGDIIGIFDAEDAPDPDQITHVARRFQQVPREVACLQGILDYYNPKQNWLARCFTIEYATWFRVLLPGLAKLGLAIPLGGTTLYFRRDVLEELGGWDAHNVTEDADLGFRLARHGYRTEVIGTVTREEANCRPWPWVKQRSRWLKGYMTTYLVHMRQPLRLYQQLGAWKFWGMQAHFITALSQFFLAPFLWSFWLVLLGLPHPLDPILSRDILLLFGKLFLSVEVLNIAIYAVAVSGPFHRHLMIWTPTMHVYTPLGTIAAYKALYEMVFAPFYWDKTTHGLSLGTAMAEFSAPGSQHAVDLAGIQLETRQERL